MLKHFKRHPEPVEGQREDYNISKLPTMLVVSLLCLTLINTCDDPNDLGAVSGIQGQIQFQGDMPDSIKAVALVVLLPQAISAPEDSIGKYLVSFSDPMSQSGEYYIQLKPGGYIGVVIGLLIDPGIFVANLDSYLEGSELPIVQLSEGLNSIRVVENIVVDRDWVVTF